MQDVDDVLAHADELLGVVAEIYEETLAAQQMGPRLKPKIKGVLSEQRSALDYLATGIRKRYGTKSKTGTYFPFARSAQSFPKHMNRKMPGVRTSRPDIAAAIECHQPYQPGHEWMDWLNGLRTRSTHATLTPLTPEVGTPYEFGGSFTVIASDEAQISHPTLGDEISVEELVGQQATYKKAVYVAWMFSNPYKPALETLLDIQRGVRALVADVSQVAGL
jgi:hypothetical protein